MIDESAVPVFDDEPQIVDTEVGERLLDSRETLAWLDQHAPDWRQYRARPPFHYAFNRRWWDVRELREWIGHKPAVQALDRGTGKVVNDIY